MTENEAIEVLQKIKPIPHRGDGKGITHTLEIIAIDMAIKALEQQPTRPTGKWIAQDIHNCHTDFKCSACGYIHGFMHLYGKPTADYTYCPNCGARMGESEKEI